MNLARVQEILNRLYTQKQYRSLFYANKKEFFELNQIADEKTIEFFLALKQDQIEFFANSLLSKRYHQVKQLLPLCATLMGEAFKNNFYDYAENALPPGIHKHHEDALAFTGYLKRQVLFKPLKNKSILLFEKDLLHNFIFSPKWYSAFYFSNPYLLKRRSNKNSAPELVFKPCFIIWKNGKMIRQINCL